MKVHRIYCPLTTIWCIVIDWGLIHSKVSIKIIDTNLFWIWISISVLNTILLKDINNYLIIFKNLSCKFTSSKKQPLNWTVFIVTSLFETPLVVIHPWDKKEENIYEHAKHFYECLERLRCEYSNSAGGIFPVGQSPSSSSRGEGVFCWIMFVSNPPQM